MPGGRCLVLPIHQLYEESEKAGANRVHFLPLTLCSQSVAPSQPVSVMIPLVLGSARGTQRCCSLAALSVRSPLVAFLSVIEDKQSRTSRSACRHTSRSPKAQNDSARPLDSLSVFASICAPPAPVARHWGSMSARHLPYGSLDATSARSTARSTDRRGTRPGRRARRTAWGGALNPRRPTCVSFAEEGLTQPMRCNALVELLDDGVDINSW